jgi:protease-4
VELSGEISDGGGTGFSRNRGARDFIDDIEDARKDKSIKAIVIRINSPGGSAAASQEMFRAVRKLGKPVICSMGDLAASGGYYVASACDTIYANGSTLTGSIGVISQFLNYSTLFKKVGLDQATIKSGKFKDAGNPARPLTAEERQLFQAMIMNVYNQFVDDVATGRKGKLTRTQVLKLADGRVYTGLQAKQNKLVDNIGGLQDAIEDAAKRAGISGDPKIKEYGGGGMLGSILGSKAETGAEKAISGTGTIVGDAAGHAFMAALRNEMNAEASSPTPRTALPTAR